MRKQNWLLWQKRDWIFWLQIVAAALLLLVGFLLMFMFPLAGIDVSRPLWQELRPMLIINLLAGMLVTLLSLAMLYTVGWIYWLVKGSEARLYSVERLLIVRAIDESLKRHNLVAEHQRWPYRYWPAAYPFGYSDRYVARDGAWHIVVQTMNQGFGSIVYIGPHSPAQTELLTVLQSTLDEALSPQFLS